MTDIRVSEWDGTPWAGEARLIVPLRGPGPWSHNDPIKAVVSDDGAWSRAVGYISHAEDPCERAKMFLQAYKVGWFYKAESKISLDIANLRRTLAPEDGAGDNETDILEADLSTPWERLDPPHQFLRLMERPNPNQTGRQLFQKTQIRTDMAGWTFWYLEGAGPVGSGMLPTAIFGISPSRLTPSFDRAGKLIGWALDKDNPSGPTMTFETFEIVMFSQEKAEGDSYQVDGQGVVEAVLGELPLGSAFSRHQTDLLATGGRLAGMMWPKERTLEEGEFEDAKRAWRSVASDPNAARRLLLFPEPMEYAQGAADPESIGIPELSELNRDNILTAFPISPYILGVPIPGGLSSGEVRKEERRAYWEGTIHPRVELLEEVIQTKIVVLYEAVTGQTYDFDIEEPNLDDATSLLEKVEAFKALTEAGFKAEDAIAILGLDGMEWTKPEPVVPVINVPDPNEPVAMQEQAPPPTKAARIVEERDRVTDKATRTARARLNDFFAEQRDRVTAKMRSSLPASKADRMKAAPTWWDAEFEDDELTKVMQSIYAEVGRGGLQAVADNLQRIIFKGATQAVIADLLEVGGKRIKDINARTLQALTIELAEGTRRGYSIPQLIDGVPAEGYKGILQAGLDNGVPVWDDTRAEMIARTETMLSYNRATITGYGEFGVTHLLAYDGDEDELCADRNGREFTIEEAEAEEEHPNGTLVWSPVVDKAAHFDPVDHTERWLEAVKSIGAPQPVYITMPDVRQPDIRVDVGEAIVSPPDLGPVTDAITSLELAVKGIVQPAPIVNVPAPVVNVPAPIVNVKTPAMNDIRVVSMPERKHKVTRDMQGRPTGSVETDA